MPVNTTQTKYFQNIGPGATALSFSTMATTMGRPGTNIRFGDYRRKTGADEVFADVNGTSDEKAAATAIVPDAVENQTCGVDGNGITTLNNHKVSSLKNMIKRYDVSYTGSTTSQISISPGGGTITDNWTSNIDLNVPKRVTFDGSTLRASTTGEHAVVFSGSALNLDLTFSGTQILGKEGVGGTKATANTSATGGSAGGGALYLRNTTSKTTGNASTINLTLSNTALIAGGGGGGGGGATGSVTGTTQCTNYNDYSYDNYYWAYVGGGCPVGCDAGDTQLSCNYNDIRYFQGTSGYSQGTWYAYPWTVTCRKYTTNNNGSVAPAAGGDGGIGQGSNSANAGAGGGASGAASLNCPGGTYAQNATSNTTAGVAGGAGGTYGAAGGTTSAANGGTAGPWLNVSNTRWANKGASGALVQRVNTV